MFGIHSVKIRSHEKGLLFRDGEFDRITSYNVCYTKLLRCSRQFVENPANAPVQKRKKIDKQAVT